MSDIAALAEQLLHLQTDADKIDLNTDEEQLGDRLQTNPNLRISQRHAIDTKDAEKLSDRITEAENGDEPKDEVSAFHPSQLETDALRSEVGHIHVDQDCL